MPVCKVLSEVAPPCPGFQIVPPFTSMVWVASNLVKTKVLDPTLVTVPKE